LIELTKEQEAIVGSSYSRGELIRVMAFAGTGKTFTLVKLAQRLAEVHPEWKILYLAFNKSIQVEAGGKFPGNTLSKTTHSLAYAAFGQRYRDQLIPDLRVREIAESMKLERKYYLLVKYGIDTLKNFLNSANQYIQNVHCPGIELKHAAFIHKVEVVELAKSIWNRMKNVDDPGVGMLHDGYLKLYQLEAEPLPYDVVLFDECQDSNPVTTDIVLKQKQALRVLVGDPHQQIYSFRGAVNAFDRVDSDRTFYLTGSFRFGTDFSNVANILLSEYKGEVNDLNGLGGEGELEKIDPSIPHAVLSRTNAGLFDEAAELWQGRKLGFLGGIRNYRFSMISDVYQLSEKNKSTIQSSYIKKFDDLEDLEEYADDMQDAEMMSLVKIVNKYGRDIPRLIKSIEGHTVSQVKTADVLLATTHKAKGFEFRRVKLKDDFTDFFGEKNKRKLPDMIPRDEINLYYVAVTRAKVRLQLNRKLKRIISYLSKKYDTYPLNLTKSTTN
jgi:F-box protein 18 (helicase)